jgi:DNA polymerase III epsilon subunit-like protein
MKAIILDTETNGKIKDFRLALTQENLNRNRAATLGNFPNITQIAWEVLDLMTGEVIKKYQSFIKPDGWTIPDEDFFVQNNMSTERCEAEGKPATEVYDILVDDMNRCTLIVCHNAAFDVPTLKADMIRYQKKVTAKLVEVCTMKESTNYCKIPNARGNGYKWPKLEELYKFLFAKEMQGAHDAFCDTSACRECFVKLVELNVILLEF